MNKQSGYTVTELLFATLVVAALAGLAFGLYTLVRLALAAINALGG